MDTPEQPPSKKPQRFFDIVPANKTKPDTSSRPIVVTNQPVQEDPMMKAKDAPKPADSPKSSSLSEPSQITVAEAMEGASEPIKLDSPSEAESAQLAKPEAAEGSSPKDEDEKLMHDMPVELPAHAASNVVVRRAGLSARMIRNIITILLIILVLVVIADLLLDLNILKIALPHTHFFGG